MLEMRSLGERLFVSWGLETQLLHRPVRSVDGEWRWFFRCFSVACLFLGVGFFSYATLECAVSPSAFTYFHTYFLTVCHCWYSVGEVSTRSETNFNAPHTKTIKTNKSEILSCARSLFRSEPPCFQKSFTLLRVQRSSRSEAGPSDIAS